MENISETAIDISSMSAKVIENTTYKDSSEISKNPLCVPTNESALVEGFHDNDNKILSLLNQQTGSYYSFMGLMRKLNLHQQSLTRSLVRLEDLGLIQRSVNGYKLKENSTANTSVLDARIRNEYKGLLQTYIPPGITAEEIVEILHGRWFNAIRWIGLMKSERSYILQWVNEDSTFQINARITWDHINIETNAVSDEDKIKAMVGSCKIFEQITRLLQARLRGHN